MFKSCVSSVVCAVALVVAVLVSPVLANENPEKSWSGASELGYVATSGNTDTQTVNAKIRLKQAKAEWENTFALEALNTAESDQTSAERYLANAQANRSVTEQDFLFGLVNYEDDRFSGFQFESLVALGYGRRLINTDRSILDVEVGPGVRFVKPDQGPSDEEGILRLAARYGIDISDTSRFEQTFSADAGEERVISKSVSSITSNINGSLAMKVSLTVRNNSEPAQATNDKTDTETAVTLVYSY